MATILVVDDQPTNREMLSTLLGYRGHRVLEAADGAEALLISRRERPDLVISDILMPTMDGLEFVRRLRADPDLYRTPVIFCTATLLHREAEALAEAAGAARLFYKPIDPEKVLAAVDALLQIPEIAAPPSLVEGSVDDHIRLLTDRLVDTVEEARALNDRLDALFELTIDLGSQRNRPILIRRLCGAARAMFAARIAVAGVKDEEAGPWEFASDGPVETAPAHASCLERLFGDIAKSGAPHRVAADADGVAAAAAIRELTGSPTNALLAVPISSPNNVYGWLCLIGKIGLPEFTEEDERLAGHIAAIAGRIYDSTALYDRLLGSENRFRCVVEAVPTALLVVNHQGVIEMVNVQAERVFGYSREELLGRGVETLLPKTYRGDHAALRSGYFSDWRVRPMGAGRDLYALRNGGEEFPVEVGLSPIDTEHGTMVLAAVIDITRRKEAERGLIDAHRRSEDALAALSESEARLRRAQRIGHMGSIFRNFVTDESGWSDETYRIFGVSPEHFVPTTENFLDQVHPDDRALVRSIRDQIRYNKTPTAYEYRIVRPDGSVRHVYRENEVIRDAAGNPILICGIIQDVTEAREAQNREQELQQQFAQAQKMEAIGSLTGGMAHDFNNLLGVVIGNLDLLRDRCRDDAETDELAREALDAALRGADLTRRLLAFARRQPLQPVLVDPNDLVSGIVALLRRVIGEDIEIALDLAPDTWRIVVDPAQLEAAITNLATNARDAMPEGGHLTIVTGNRRLDADYAALHADLIPGDYAMIEVSDTGAGMPQAVMSRIFEPFYTTKEQGKGTGLGLSMVYGFIKQSGGHINVYSEPGIGTTFRLYLPRDLPHAVAGSAASAAVAEAGTPLGQGEAVLVVEDNAHLRRVVMRQVRELGYRAFEAENAAAALDLLARERIDLLFSDVVLPGELNGIGLARLARSQLPGLRTVLTSGFPGKPEIDFGGRLLPKPYRKADLAQALCAALAEPSAP
jgi:PAS domain S-box-containing protein